MNEFQRIITTSVSLIFPGLNPTRLFHKEADPKQWESLLFQICNILDPTLATQLFESCYPAALKPQSKVYRTNLFKFAETLKRTGVLPAMLMFRKSDFEELRGPRFERVVCAMLNILIQNQIGETDNAVFELSKPLQIKIKQVNF